VQRSSIDQWISEYLIPSQQQVVYNGVAYPVGQGLQTPQTPGITQTAGATHVQTFEATLPGHTQALKSCPPAFAAELVRALVLSQARFTFRNRPGQINARKTFGTRDLGVLERPWPNGTTADLIGQMEWHAGVGGNAFVTNHQPKRLRMLRPDWTALLWGSDLEPDAPQHALDGELLGYLYCNGGFASGNRVVSLPVDEVAHWYPIPDPLNPGLGMSWVTPAIREIRGDLAASEHKLKFFANGATPNLVIKGIPATTQAQFDELVAMMESRHAGVANAYRTLYLTTGADATVVGSSLQDMDFSQILATGETRLSVLSRVPAALLGVTEGLKGAALNAGNFGMARRIFSDTWVTPTLQNLANSLAPLVNVPNGAELWFDTADIPLMREDAADAASIIQTQAATIVALANAGYNADKVVTAVTAGDLTTLAGAHSGMLSVQLQTPGADGSSASSGASAGDGAAPQRGALDLVSAIQRIYLGVGTVITSEEARRIVNELGAGLDLPGPTFAGKTGATP
jgi:phage portal protein BeeE